MTDPTPQQAAFIAAMSGEGNIALDAKAGSGKTTSLVAGATSTGAVGLACAFNKKNAVDLSERMPPSMECKTMNALGHGSWMKQLGKRVSVDGDKAFKLCKQLYSWEDLEETSGLRKLVDLARINMIVPKGARYMPEGMNDQQDRWEEIIDRHEIEGEERVLIYRAREVLKRSIEMAWQGEIDFNDQLYMPICYSGPFTKYPLVLVDEAQDLSPIQHRMIKRMTGGRLVIAGDPNQAIYGFRGATDQAMNVFIEDFNMQRLPLTWSFRCPKGVVREAQRYCPEIESAPWAPEGEVIHEGGLKQVRRGDTIISWRNATIISAAYSLIAAGIGARLVDGDLGKTLLRVLDKYSGPDENFSNHFLDYISRLMEDARRKGKDGAYKGLSDKRDVFQIILRRSGADNRASLRLAIAEIFKATEAGGPDAVLCSTIHKAKGLEWNRVHVLNISDLFRKASKLSPAEYQQRMNMAYVAITRSKNYLNLSKIETEVSEEAELEGVEE